MILYVILAAFIAGVGAGGYGVHEYYDAKAGRLAAKQAAAQEHIDQLAAKVNAEAAAKMAAMKSAFEQGEAQAKVITRNVYIKGQDYVRESPQVYANPNCVLPASSLQLANSEIARVRAEAAAALGISLPDAGAPERRGDGNTVHIVPGKPRADAGVHSQVQPVPGASGSAGAGVQRPAKPAPK